MLRALVFVLAFIVGAQVSAACPKRTKPVVIKSQIITVPDMFGRAQQFIVYTAIKPVAKIRKCVKGRCRP